MKDPVKRSTVTLTVLAVLLAAGLLYGGYYWIIVIMIPGMR